MPILDGYLIIAKDVPTFVIPVLVDRPGSNHSLIQQIDVNNRIVSFFEIDVGNNHEDTPFKFEFNVGDKAVWAFRSLAGEISFSDFAGMKKELGGRLFAGEFDNFPLIESQVAKFCDNSLAYSGALSKSYKLIQSRSKLAAAIWRDSSILLPLAKKDLARAVPKHLTSEIDETRLLATGTTILLELPGKLHDFLVSQSTELELADTLAIGNAFGLTSYGFTGVAVGSNPTGPETKFDEMYGELVPFTGIGDMVAQNSPSFRRIRRLIPPWITKNKNPAAKWPLVTFCVINTDPETIVSAIEFVKTRARETVKIAIVTLPITFGTSSRHRLDLIKLDSVRPHFDYVFIIGNHVLQKPTGRAPRLTASSRAVKYVRACVDGIMQVVWASGAPSTRKEFFAIFPRDGFGVVGRALGTKDTPPEQILQEAIASALNDRLPLRHARRLSLVGPPHIVDDSHILSFLDKTADATLSQTISIVSTNRRAAVTLLGFGVRPVEQSERRHREFCLELLYSKNFSVIRETAAVVRGEFAKNRKIVIGFSSSERSLGQVIAAIEKTSLKTRCVLTNFVLSPSDVDYFWRRRIAVFHYTLLDIYLAQRMSLTPLQRGP
jgi:hypothetical protein